MSIRENQPEVSREAAAKSGGDISATPRKCLVNTARLEDISLMHSRGKFAFENKQKEIE